MTLKEALARIEELERENEELREQLKEYQGRKFSGRKKHDEKWQESYHDFVIMYEGGSTIMEIVNKSDFSRRTAYRYKAYYDALVKNQQEPLQQNAEQNQTNKKLEKKPEKKPGQKSVKRQDNEQDKKG